MFHIITCILPLYLICRIILPLKIGILPKIFLCLIISIIGLKIQIFHAIFGNWMPDLPRYVIAITGALHGTLVILAILYILKDISLILYRPSISKENLALYLTIISILLSSYGTYQALKVPDIKSIHISSQSLPDNIKQLKIIHLSDLHISSAFTQEWVQKVVDNTNQCNPDLIFITGDIADGDPDKLQKDLSPLKELKSTFGVYACTGNHEYYWGYKRWMNAINNLGITVLENQNVVIKKNGTNIVVAGITDDTAKNFNLPEPDIQKAFFNAPSDAYKILLAHRPASFDENIQYTHLQLSGHTHGGQIWGLDKLVALFNKNYLRGLYSIEKSILNISSGCALWAGFPIRIFVPSYIIEINISN